MRGVVLFALEVLQLDADYIGTGRGQGNVEHGASQRIAAVAHRMTGGFHIDFIAADIGAHPLLRIAHGKVFTDDPIAMGKFHMQLRPFIRRFWY